MTSATRPDSTKRLTISDSVQAVTIPIVAVVDRRRRDPAQALELRLDRVVGEIVELLLVEPAAGHRDQADRDVREVEAQDERLLDPRRQAVQDLLDALDDLGLALFTSAPQFIHTRTVESPCRDFDSTCFTSLTALTAFSIG